MPRSNRFLFPEAIQLARSFGGRTLVELGSIRSPDAKNSDGHSTLAWAEAGFDVWSVDLDVRATKLTERLLAGKYANVRCLTCEGIWFLKMFPETIALLYLDGPHPDQENGRLWAREALAAALPKLAPPAVLLIDDTDLPRRGKGEFAIPLAEESGFKLVDLGRQALLVRNDP